jgi:hypothetical protein
MSRAHWKYGNPNSRIPTFPLARLRRTYFSTCQRSTGRSSRRRGLRKGTSVPDAPYRLFRVGRFTQTQTSWPAPISRRSCKWMSGYAVIALAQRKDRGPLGTTTQLNIALGGSSSPSEGKSPFSLDCYLSWMSPGFRLSPGFCGFRKRFSVHTGCRH